MEAIEVNGREFKLGCLERTALVGAVRPCLASAVELMAEADYQPVDWSRYLPPIGLQGEHNSCVGAQTSNAIMGVRKQVGGLGVTPLSQWDLYRRICNGQDEGASIAEAVKMLHGEGVCEVGLCPNFTLSTQATPEVIDNRKLHKLEESFDAPDRRSIATGVQRGFLTPLGLKVYTNFGQVEEIEGEPCVPRPAGRLRGWHCVIACGMKKIGGLWRLNVATKSWGLDFADQGCVYYPLDWIDNGYADAWAFRTVTVSRK